MLPVSSSGRRVDSRSLKERGELCLWFRGAGILHQKSGMRNVRVSLSVSARARVLLEPVMSPSKSSVHQIAWHVVLQAEQTMLHYWSPWVTLTKD